MPRWRPFSWVIVVANLLFLVWIVAAIAGGSDSCAEESGLAKDVCDTLATVGASVAVAVVALVWALVDVILGVLWVVTRPDDRPCTVCGSRVHAGVTTCPSCGYDFRAAAIPDPGSP